MKKNLNKSFYIFLLLSVLAVISSGCKKTLTVEEEKYIQDVMKERADKDLAFQKEDGSPFKRDSSIKFEPLKYFAVDPGFVFKGKLIKYASQDTVTTFGTKGDKRLAVRYGWFSFKHKDQNFKVNVYKSRTRTGLEYYGIWFTDRTTGKETYGVGRYIDFTISPDPTFEYTIDFNLAYNPYCAYSALYSCSIPLKEDFIDMEITAGEKKFHH